jgi:hypothetical protein
MNDKGHQVMAKAHMAFGQVNLKLTTYRHKKLGSVGLAETHVILFWPKYYQALPESSLWHFV